MYRIKNCKIDGIVACIPARNENNAESLKRIYGSDAENIVRATGIRTRCLVDEGVSSLELIYEAAKKLITETQTLLDEIGAVICVTFTPKFRMPFNSTLLQNMLGLGHEVLAFDLSIACSGYTYGLYVAAMTAQNTNKKVLLLDGDVQSVFTSPYDKGTLPVLADGGTATIIAPNCTNDEWLFNFYTDGARGDGLIVKAGGSKGRLCEDDLNYHDLKDGSKIRNTDIFMDGFEIFKFVAKDVVQLIRQTIDNEIDNIDVFVPHQANMYMIKQLCRSVKISDNKMWRSGDVFGNSSSATVPVTIAYHAERGLLKKNSRVLLSGFGGGLSAGAVLANLYNDAYYTLIRYQGDKS